MNVVDQIINQSKPLINKSKVKPTMIYIMINEPTYHQLLKELNDMNLFGVLSSTQNPDSLIIQDVFPYRVFKVKNRTTEEIGIIIQT